MTSPPLWSLVNQVSHANNDANYETSAFFLAQNISMETDKHYLVIDFDVSCNFEHTVKESQLKSK